MKTNVIPTIPANRLKELETLADRRREEILNTPNMELPCGSTVYYLSPNGDDANNGLSPSTAWKTIDKLKEQPLPHGSYVCFERGGIWRGQFSACAGVTYTAYGEGPKPELRGSPYDGAVDGYWEEVAKNIWKYSETFTGDIGMVVFNHGEENALKILLDHSGEQTVERVSRKVWNGYESLDENYEFIHDLGGRVTTNMDGGYLYLYCDKGNPATIWKSIEFIMLGAVINIRKNNDVTVDNLCLKYSNFGICSGKDNLRVQNCEIGWIGGSIQGYTKEGLPWRYGNGVEIYGGCLNFVCDNNWVYQCYDTGLTQQRRYGDMDIIMDGIYYTNNLIEKCEWSIEYFLGEPDAGTSPTRYMTNFYIRNNILLDAGYGFGKQRPDTAGTAHIKGWDHMNPVCGDFIIENNTLLRSRNMMIHTGCSNEGDEPIYRNNIFVQNEDGQFGRNGMKPTTLRMYTADVVGAEQYAENEFYVIK